MISIRIHNGVSPELQHVPHLADIAVLSLGLACEKTIGMTINAELSSKYLSHNSNNILKGQQVSIVASHRNLCCVSQGKNSSLRSMRCYRQ